MSGINEAATMEIAKVVEDYFAMWNEADVARRREIIAGGWAEDPTYKDPMVAADSREALVVMVDGVQAQFPGHRFSLTSAIDAYEDRARWNWQLAGPHGVIAAGVDYAELDGQGRLQQVTGFIDQLMIS